jgi:hypothetical protein
MSQRTSNLGPPARPFFTLRRAAFGALLCAGVGLGDPGTAAAADPGPDTLPIHVIALQTTTDADDQAEALTKALRSAIRAMPGWSLGEGDNSLEVLVLKLQCAEPPDATCQSRIGDVIKSDRYVWGILNKKDKTDNVLGELNYWVRGQGTNKHTVEYSANLTEPNDDALKKVAMDAITGLTGGPPKGQLHVKAGNVNGQLFVDGQPIGPLTNGEGTFAVPSGQRKITIKAAGFSDAETTTVVKPTGTVDVALNPIPLDDSKPVDMRKVGGFIGLGAGVALGAVGAVSGVMVMGAQDTLNPYRPRVATGDNICNTGFALKDDAVPLSAEETSKVTEACNQSFFGPLQFVFYGLGALVAGTGVYLLMTSGTSSAPAAKPATGWTFAPSAGPTGGGLQARYTF